MVSRALLTSNSDEWETPHDFWTRLDAEFDFVLDAAAQPENAKCARHISSGYLESDWAEIAEGGAVWINPPFSDLGHSTKVIDKCIETARNGSIVVFLGPARTDTRWFQKAFAHAAELRFVSGRLRFGNAKNSAPFPTALFIFRPGIEGVKTVTYFAGKLAA